MIADLPNTEQRRVSETRALVFITLLSGALCSMIAFYFSDRTPYLGYHDSPDYMRMADNFINHQVLSLESHAEGKPFYPTNRTHARLPGFAGLDKPGLWEIGMEYSCSEFNIISDVMPDHFDNGPSIIWFYSSRDDFNTHDISFLKYLLHLDRHV